MRKLVIWLLNVVAFAAFLALGVILVVTAWGMLRP